MGETLSKFIPQEALDKLSTSAVSEYLPRMGKALAILIIGWLVAVVVSFLVRLAINKTGLNKHLAGVLPSSGGRAPNVGRLIGKLAFYLIMLFVAVAFLQALELTMVTEPLNAFLGNIMEYLPRLIGAGVLGAVAWVVATVVRTGSQKGLDALDLESRLMATTGEEVEETGELGLSKTVSETLYWLIFLLFLPAILGALQMPGLLEPVQSMMQQGMDFLPNLFGAGIIGGVGYFVAKIVQRVVTNLLSASGADRLSERVGITGALGSQKLSGLLGLICYALILIPVIVAALNALQIDAVTEPASAMLNQITGALPNIFAGGLVLGISFFVGKIVSGLATNVLQGVGFDDMPAKLGFNASVEGSQSPSSLVGRLILAAILFFAGMQAMNFMGLSMVAEEMNGFLGFFFQILVGVVILGLGLYLANLAADTIKGSGVQNGAMLAKVARIAIVVLAGAMGLQRMGLADSIVNLTFGLTLGAVAVASAIAFGWGGRDAAKRIMDRYVS